MPYTKELMNIAANKTHHCPICNRPCTYRCEAKGHVVRCHIHPERFHRPGWSCISCDQAETRTVGEERKKRQQEREAKKVEEESSERKKTRCPEKMERKRQEAEASAAEIKKGGWVKGKYYEPGEPEC